MNKYGVKLGNGVLTIVEADTFDVYQQQGVTFSVREPNPDGQQDCGSSYIYTSVAFFRDVDYVVLGKYLEDTGES